MIKYFTFDLYRLYNNSPFVAIVITHADLQFVFYPCLQQLTVLYLLQNNLTQSQDKALRRISEMKEVNCFNLILNYQLQHVISSKSF